MMKHLLVPPSGCDPESADVQCARAGGILKGGHFCPPLLRLRYSLSFTACPSFRAAKIGWITAFRCCFRPCFLILSTVFPKRSKAISDNKKSSLRNFLRRLFKKTSSCYKEKLPFSHSCNIFSSPNSFKRAKTAASFLSFVDENLKQPITEQRSLLTSSSFSLFLSHSSGI